MAARVTVLRTPRLRLTTWLPDDLDDLAALHADPRVMRYMTTGPQETDATRRQLATYQQEQQARGWSKWRVEDGDGTFVGRAGFGCPHNTGHRELGYLLARPAWGRGYATELALALMRWHHEHPDPQFSCHVQAYVFSENHPSQRVLTKAGFRAVGPAPEDGRQVLFDTRTP